MRFKAKEIWSFFVALAFLVAWLPGVAQALYKPDTAFNGGNPLFVTDTAETPYPHFDQSRAVSCVDPATQSLIMAWVEDTGSYDEIWVQKISPAGVRQWGPQGARVFRFAHPNRVVDLAIACIGGGSAAIATVDATNAQVHVQKVTDAAPTGAWSPHVVLNGDPVGDPAADTTAPRLAMAFDNDSTNPAVHVGFLSPDGSNWDYYVRGVGVGGTADGQFRYDFARVWNDYQNIGGGSQPDFAGAVSGYPGAVWFVMVGQDSAANHRWNAVNVSNTGGLLYANNSEPGVIYTPTGAPNACFVDTDGEGGVLMACDDNAANVVIAGADSEAGQAYPYTSLTIAGATAVYGLAYGNGHVFVLYDDAGTTSKLDWLEIAYNNSGSNSLSSSWSVDLSSYSVTTNIYYPNPGVTGDIATAKLAYVGDDCAAYTWLEGGIGSHDLYAQVICDHGGSPLAMFTEDDTPLVMAHVTNFNDNTFLAAHGSAYAVALEDDPESGTGTLPDTYEVASFDWEARPDLWWQTSLGASATFDWSAGGTINVTSGTVENDGQADFPNATTVRFYLVDTDDFNGAGSGRGSMNDFINYVHAGAHAYLVYEAPLSALVVGSSQSVNPTINIDNMTDLAGIRCWSSLYLCAVIDERDPATSPEGAYYLREKADGTTDNNVSCTSLTPTQHGPDLRISSVGPAGDWVPGDTLDLSGFQVANNGDRAAGPFEVCFYLYDDVFGTSPSFTELRDRGVLLGCQEVPGLTESGGGNDIYGDDEAWEPLQIPYDANPDINEDGSADTYHLYAVVDRNDDVLEKMGDELCDDDTPSAGTNYNDALSSFDLVSSSALSGQPDLWVDASIVYPNDNYVEAGDTIQVSYTVRNMGGPGSLTEACSAPTTVYFCLSNSTSFNATACVESCAVEREDVICLDTRPVPGLAAWPPGAGGISSFSETVNLTVPASVRTGQYYLFAYVAPPEAGGGCVAEINTGWQWFNSDLRTFSVAGFPAREAFAGDEGMWYLGYGGRNASPIERDIELWVSNEGWSVTPTDLCLYENETADVTVSGGIPPYSVFGGNAAVASANVVDDGTGDLVGTVRFEGVGVGTTTWTVDDSSTVPGVTPAVNVNVRVVDPLAVDSTSVALGVGGTVEVHITQPACGGVTVQNNSNPMVVNATLTGTVLHLEGLAAGSAVITLQDSAGHTLDVNVTVNGEITVTAPSCVTMADTATVTVSGGVAPYDVSCDPAALVSGCPGAGFTGGSFDLTPQDLGTVTVTATDASSASASATIEIRPALSASVPAVSVAAGESVQVTFSGGCGSCNLVDAGNSAVALVTQDGCTFTVSGVAEGTTSFTVNDDVPGNSVTVAVVVTGASAMTVNPESLCLLSGETGTTQVFGGVAPYSVTCEGGLHASVAGSTITVDATGAAPGTYTCTVDDSSAAAPVSFTVNVAENVSVADDSLEVYEGHSATTSVSGGCGDYSATSGDTSVATASITGHLLTVTGVAAGSTMVEVCDAVGGGDGHCATVNVNVQAYTGSLIVSPNAFNLVLGETSSAMISGGAPPYAVSANFNPAVATATVDGNILNITASTSTTGTTSIVVQDSFGSTTVVSVEVREPISVTPNSLNLASEGSGSAAISGGYAPYTCASENPAVSCAVSESTLNLTAAAVTSPSCGEVMVTDHAGHQAGINVCVYPGVVVNPDAFNLTIGGEAHATIEGGFGAYSATSSNPAVATASVSGSDLTITGVAAGSAVITVSDELGQTFDVNVQVYPGVVVNPDELTLYTGSSYNVAVTGGLAPYTAMVDDPDVVSAEFVDGNTLRVVALGGGATQVTVTDQLGQTATVAVTVNDWVDLEVVDFVTPVGSVKAGDTISVSYAVRNNGSEEAPVARVAVYLSTDNTLDASDTLVRGALIDALGAGETRAYELDVELPDGLASGTWYLILAVDPEDDIAERYEDNNVMASAITIAEPAYPEIDIDVANVDGYAEIYVTVSSCGDFCDQLATVAIQADIGSDNTIDYSFVPGMGFYGWVPGAQTFTYPLSVVPTVPVLSADMGIPYSALSGTTVYFTIYVDGEEVASDQATF